MPDMESARRDVVALQRLLDRTPEGLEHVRLRDDAWTLCEVVGHLVDSAANNHQRFVRLCLGNLEHFPGYDAETWVGVQFYDRFDFSSLCALWSSYNKLLLHLVARIPEDSLSHTWEHGGVVMSLDFIVNDYYRHLREHTNHYAQRLKEVVEYAG